MVFPLVRILSAASDSNRHFINFPAPRLDLAGDAYLYPASSICACLYSEADGESGLALCIANVRPISRDIQLAIGAKPQKWIPVRQLTASATSSECPFGNH